MLIKNGCGSNAAAKYRKDNDMKKILCIISTMAVMLSLAACDNSTHNSSAAESGNSTAINSGEQSGGTAVNPKTKTHEAVVPVNVAADSFDNDFQKCKSKDYINLDWTNAKKTQTLSFTECHDIEVNFNAENKQSNRDVILNFEKYCKFFFGEEYDSKYIGCSAPDSNFKKTTLKRNGEDYFEHILINDHRQEFEADDTLDLGWITYLDPERNYYLWGSPETNPHWMDKGLAIEMTGKNFRPMGLIPSDLLREYPYETFYNDGTLDDKVYRLYDGEYSMRDAIDYFVNEFYPSLPYNNADDLSCAVKSVSAVKITNDMYLYFFDISQTFNSIMFEYRGENSSSSPSSRFTLMGGAIMAKKNDIDKFYIFTPYVKEVGDPITEMLSLETAADIASENLSDIVKFEVLSAELIYSGDRNSESDIQYLKPTWLFKLVNTNDDLCYSVYVDAVSGECSYVSYQLL